MTGSTPIVSETNRTWISDFRGVRTLILTVSQLRLPPFSTDRHKNPNSAKINQLWLRTRWSTKPEIEFVFYRGANFGFGIDFVSSRMIIRTHFFTDFYQILRAARKCGRFDAYCLSDKTEVHIRFYRCAHSDFGSFDIWRLSRSR